MNVKDKCKTLNESVKPYFALIIIVLFLSNLAYMISTEIKMKKIQENIVTIDYQVKENKKVLSNLKNKLFGGDWGYGDGGILTEMSDKLEDIESKMEDIESKIRYIY